MSREWHLFLTDAIQFCERIRQFTAGLDRLSFEADQKTYDATLRNLELIGEAVKQIPDVVLSRHSEIPWRDIIATRNYLSHVYFGVDNDVIWNIITEKLAPLTLALCDLELQTRSERNEASE